MEFHQAIANCSGNFAIYRMIPYIHQMQLLYRTVAEKQHLSETAEEHRRIADAIARKRGADAADAMQYHLTVIYNRLK